MEAGWHVYSHDNDPLDGPIPTSFTLSTEGVEADVARECTPEVHYDPNFDKDVKSFEGTVRWALDVTVGTGDRPERIDGLLTYMACDDSKCIFPPDVEFQLGTSRCLTAPLPALCPERKRGRHDTSRRKGDDGLLVLFLLGMGLGFAALFTPCVFPLIPMTVSFFHQAIQDAGRRHPQRADLRGQHHLHLHRIGPAAHRSIWGRCAQPDLHRPLLQHRFVCAAGGLWRQFSRGF